MPFSIHEHTLFVPKQRGASLIDRATTGLPPDLLNRAALRLQILAWLDAFTFFMAAFSRPLLLPEGRRMLLDHLVHTIPGAISIAAALAVAFTVRLGGLRPALVTVLALAFEMVSRCGTRARRDHGDRVESIRGRVPGGMRAAPAGIPKALALGEPLSP
jgi:hypothetical protein